MQALSLDEKEFCEVYESRALRVVREVLANVAAVNTGRGSAQRWHNIIASYGEPENLVCRGRFDMKNLESQIMAELLQTLQHLDARISTLRDEETSIQKENRRLANKYKALRVKYRKSLLKRTEKEREAKRKA